MRLSISAQSHVGLVRTNNEDMILIGSRRVRDEVYEITLPLDIDSPPLVIALADGMGGHQAGEVASEQTLQSLAAFANGLPAGLSAEELTHAFSEWIGTAHSHLLEMGTCDPACQGMGTTLVGLCIYAGRAYWFNCGDSRIYRMRDGELRQLSTDHSYEWATGVKGHSNVITNCVGAGGGVFLDMCPIDPFPAGGTDGRGDTYLLCSDGLSDLVDDDQLARFLRAEATAPALVRMALQAGGRDNVSAVTVRVAL